MENSTLERRVELIKKARELSSQNRETINGVQKIVNENEPVLTKHRTSFWGLKLLLVILLFAGYIFLDQNKVGNFVVTSDDITKVITYNINIDQYVEEVFKQIK